MSKLIAFAAIQGGYKVVSEVEGLLDKALQTYDASTKVGFPNTAYYLPVIYSITGIKVETLEDLKNQWHLQRVFCHLILNLKTGFRTWDLSLMPVWPVLLLMK